VGLDEGVEPDSDMKVMAARYLDAVRSVQPRGPYLLGGWSLGGSAAFEMARQLTAQGDQVASLVLIDSPAPRAGSPPSGEGQILAAFASDLARGLGLTWEGQVAPENPSAFDEVARMVPHLNPEHLRILYRTFRANVLARAGYQPRPYSGRVLVVRAGDPGSAPTADPSLGWASLAPGGISAHVVPGDHYSIMRRPSVVRLAALVDSEIEASP
jgi:thioesterase domain-containing protein